MSGVGTLHHDTYFARMAESLGDKARILDALVPGTVLDLGSGDGGLVRVLQEAGWDAVGIDASAQAVARSDGVVRHGWIEQAPQVFAGRTFDNVVFCSSLHEVWSYAEGDRDDAWHRCVAGAAGLLNPGGRCVVRDGVGPAHPDAVVRLTPINFEDAVRFLDEWIEMAQGLLGPITITAADGALVGSARHVTEFLMTYGWGWPSLPREGLEYYTVAGDLAGYGGRLAAATGLATLQATSWLQPGYAKAFDRLGSFEASIDGAWQPSPWPDSNALWVLGSPSGGLPAS